MSVRFRAAVVAIVVLVVCSVRAQVPAVVTTLATPLNGGNSYVKSFTPVGDAIYFVTGPESSAAIWKWTEAGGVVRVKSILQSGAATSMMAFGDRLLVSAYMDGRGTELWVTDGTSAGTALVKDIHTGGSSAPVLVAASGSNAYFVAYHPDYGRELWITDGTEAGTSLVADMAPGTASSNPTAGMVAGAKLYVHASGQLWVSDGTAAGTIALASGVSGTAAATVNGTVVFLGSDEIHGRELWVTDGTPGGTTLLEDIHAGARSSWGSIPTRFVPADGTLLFFADDGAAGYELWRTDGTAAGTELVSDVTPGAGSSALDDLSATTGGVFFTVAGTTLWFSDGTNAGTAAVETFSSIVAMVAASQGAYVVTDAPALVFSDGTAGGATAITNVEPTFAPALTAFGSQAAFIGNDGSSGIEPWISDGSEAGTRLMGDVSASTQSTVSPGWMTPAGNNLFFSLGEQLFASDGTAGGTFAVGVLPPTYSYGSIAAASEVPEGLVYRGGQGEATHGLWKSDGTVAGTALLKPFKTLDRFFGTRSGYALFAGSEGSNWDGGPLWRTDGTAAGTRQIGPTAAGQFTELAGTTYFLVMPYGGLGDLWATNGTPETTRLIASGGFATLGTAGGALYLTRWVEGSGRELWRSDGTADGLRLVKDIVAGKGSSDPMWFASANNLLFFTAADGVYGSELWRSDGTEAGTFLLRDIAPGTASAWISELVTSGRHVYFSVRSAAGEQDLWRSDGTSAGTIQVTNGAYVSGLSPVDGRTLFSGNDLVRGTELWESDGSIAGTYASFDLRPGSVSSNPRHITAATDRVFFTTNDARLWVLDRDPSRVSIADARVVEGDAGTKTLNLAVTRSGVVSGAASVTYATADVTATAGVDYQAASGTLSFAAGEMAKQISIVVSGDTLLEQNESFAVILTGATGATIVRERGFGLIDENDRQVALSVAYVPASSNSWDVRRTFRITNAGPSGATVTLKVSESPFEGAFDCDGRNPSVCQVGYVGPGTSVDFVARRSGSAGRTDPAIIPGRTLTATVSALEFEANVSDNTISLMTAAAGHVSLPAALTGGATEIARVTAQQGYFPATLQLTLSGGVVVSPSSVIVTEAEPVASVNLSVSPSAWGWSTVKLGASNLMRIPFASPGESIKLDTALVTVGVQPYESYVFQHQEDVVLPLRMAATLPDGTRPSGTLTLVRSDDGSIVQSRSLDANGDATFTLTGLAVGSYGFRAEYSGDSAFNPLTVSMPAVQVQGYSTYMQATLLNNPCGDFEVEVTVGNPGGHMPTGSVSFSDGSTNLGSVTLEPTASAGVARANFSYPLAGTWATISVRYIPDAPFQESWDYVYYQRGVCPPPTLIASAATTTSVSLLWSDVGAHSYEIVRAEAPAREAFTTVGFTSATTFVDSSAAAGRAYLYRVIAKSAGGVVLSTSGSDLATTVIFSDDPIVFRTTPVRAAHVNQLQQAANAVRLLAGLENAATFAPAVIGGPVRPGDLTSLRTAIEEALTVLNRPLGSWAAGVTAGGLIKAAHVQQIRNVMK